MRFSEIMLQFVYAMSLAYFSYHALEKSLLLLGVAGFAADLVWILAGCLLVIVGLWHFTAGLSLGFVLAGVFCVIRGGIIYGLQLGQGLKFFASFLVLMLLLFSWYRMTKTKGK